MHKAISNRIIKDARRLRKEVDDKDVSIDTLKRHNEAFQRRLAKLEKKRGNKHGK